MKDYLQLGIDKGLISFNEDKSRIRYNWQKKERKYDWKEDNCEQLFQDLMKFYNSDLMSHFFERKWQHLGR